MNSDNWVWHYTDAAGLIGLAVNHELWATGVDFLNDPGEAGYAVAVMRDVFKQLPNGTGEDVAKSFERGPNANDHTGFSRRFIACATREVDSLELWRGYGANHAASTYAVALDPSVPLGPRVRELRTQPAKMGTLRPWTDVNYETHADAVARTHPQLHNALSQIRRDYAAKPESGALDEKIERWRAVDEAYEDLLASSKHTAYAAEREARISYTLRAWDEYEVRATARGPVAYVPITATEQWGEHVTTAQPLPIRAVMSGPGAPANAARAIAAVLERGRHSHTFQDNHHAPDDAPPPVRILRSEIPFV